MSVEHCKVELVRDAATDSDVSGKIEEENRARCGVNRSCLEHCCRSALSLCGGVDVMAMCEPDSVDCSPAEGGPPSFEVKGGSLRTDSDMAPA